MHHQLLSFIPLVTRTSFLDILSAETMNLKGQIHPSGYVTP